MVLEINFLHWNLSVCNKLHDTTIVSTSQPPSCVEMPKNVPVRAPWHPHCCHLIFPVISVCLREMAAVGNRSLGRFSRVTDLQFYKTLAGHGARNQEEFVQYIPSPAHWGLSEQFRRPSGFRPSGCSDWVPGLNLSTYKLTSFSYYDKKLIILRSPWLIFPVALKTLHHAQPCQRPYQDLSALLRNTTPHFALTPGIRPYHPPF